MKILFLSDFGAQGSGYLNIAVPLCKGLKEKGHEVIAIGMTYNGEPHEHPFTIIPCPGFQDAVAMLQNLTILWPFDAFVVAMDIPIQLGLIKESKLRKVKHIAITPLESGPLAFSWANGLSEADKVFFISQLAQDEAVKAGLENTEHMVVGLDTEAWRIPIEGEKKSIRDSFAIPDDAFVILTVADNQERKNLSGSIEVVSKLKKSGLKVRYIMVTREQQSVGWNLRDLALQFDLSSELMIFERGLPFKDLWMLYAASDAFLLTSKAEGLGMPILEAMSVGLPIVATRTGAIPEHLGQNERGWIIDHNYSFIDPYGNSERYFADTEHGTEQLLDISSSPDEVSRRTKAAREYVEGRKWEQSVLQLEKAVESLREDKK